MQMGFCPIEREKKHVDVEGGTSMESVALVFVRPIWELSGVDRKVPEQESCLCLDMTTTRGGFSLATWPPHNTRLHAHETGWDILHGSVFKALECLELSDAWSFLKSLLVNNIKLHYCVCNQLIA